MMVHPMFRQVSRSIGEKSGGIWETSLIGDGNFPGGMEGSEQERSITLFNMRRELSTGGQGTVSLSSGYMHFGKG